MSLPDTLHGRRDRAPRAGHTWSPVTGTVFTVPAAGMDDAWAAGEAHGTDYHLGNDSPPRAVLTAWAYPAHAGFEESDGYMVVTAFGHILYGDDGEPYGCVTREASGDTLIYRSLPAAQRAAREYAEEMAHSTWTRLAPFRHQTGFDWDGTPW